MAGLIIEGVTNDISEPQLNYIKSVLEQRGYKDNKVLIEPVGKAGDNYVANVKRIIVEESNGSTFKMIAKVAPASEMLRQMHNTEALFRNEHIMYTKVLPKYTQLEKAADVPPHERLRYAACYGSSNDVPNEVIILEDLNESNFKMLDRFKSIGNECVRSILENFALLHSLSYALKYKEPELYQEYKDSLYDMWADKGEEEEFQKIFLQWQTDAAMMLEDDYHKKLVEKCVTESMDLSVKNAKIDRDSKHAVITQGDPWTNNIMFKFDGHKLLESVMIDYQISKDGNPVLDILYMISNCTDYQCRKENFHDWIDYYHTELDKALSTFGLKASFVYSKDQLDFDLKKYAKISFGQSVFLTAAFSMNTEEASQIKQAIESNDVEQMMKQTNLSQFEPATVALIKSRIEGLVESYHEFGLL